MKFPFDPFFRNHLKPTWVYRTGTAPQASADEREDAEQLEQQREETQTRRQRQSEIERADVSAETKQYMRECLASDSIERQNLLDRFLRHEIASERQFLEELRTIEREDASWETIFTTQREIRKKIQALQWRAESYLELIPHQKQTFEVMVKDIRGLNRQDDATDRGLKRALHGLVTPGQNQPAVLNAEEAREIYMVNPVSVGFESTVKKYQSKIEAAPNGKSIFRRIIALKKEEGRIERQFGRLYSELDRIIQRNLSKVRRKAEREKLLKAASRAVGVTIHEGIEIEFNEPDILAIAGRKNTVKISRISFDEVTIFDHGGHAIDKRDGVPHIHLSNGATMTLGRFKKWVDAVDGVERVTSLDDVERATGLAAYGIKLEEGMELSYPRRKRDNQGNVTSVPTYVRIEKIHDGKIHFNEPVVFQPGLENLSEDDMRDSLTYGEFIKWWHRYEVEKSVGLQELRELLQKHNELENKIYGIEAKENPPILLEEREELRYPDDSGLTFRIEGVDSANGIVLDTGERFTFPEFFYWVKNNHVQRVPEREKTLEEKAKEAERQAEIATAEAEQEEKYARKEHEGYEREMAIAKHAKDLAAGPLTERIKQIWWTTQLLSLKDLWNMTLEIVEFVKRKHQRRSKGRYGEVGSRLPWVLGTEFERVKQAAENEEVSKYKEAMEQWSVEKVKQTLHETNSRDEAKACIQTLIHKGEMRWDDHHFWKTLNRLTARYTLRGAELYIPEPHLIPKGKSGEDMSIPAMDALWGEGTGAEWFMENTSKYNSNKNNFEYKFKQLENDPKGTGGPAGECNRLLRLWRDGGYVNAQEYEAMLDGAIKFGKMSAEDKMFFILAGVLAKQGDNPHGETLMHIDRMGELDSKYLNNFPLLDFFTQVKVEDKSLWDAENKKWGKKRKLNLEDYQEMMIKYFPDDFQNCKPSAQFSKFMWEVMLMEEEVRTRISKGIRNAENMDHDDAHLFIPPTTPSEVDNLTTGPTGQKKYFTNEGYANGYPGFNQYVLSLSYSIEEETDADKQKNKVIALRDALNSFVRYDAILDNRFLREEGDRRARLDDRHYNRRTVVDDSKLKLHQDQLRNLVKEVGKAYGQNWDWLYAEKFGLDAEGKKKQTEYERKVNELKEQLTELMRQDNGQKALEVIQRARERDIGTSNGLRGIQSSKRPSKEELGKLRAKSREMEAMMGGGHGGHH